VRWLVVIVGALFLFGVFLAAAEASISRMSRVRALALQEDGRRNAGTLVEIESDPPRYLNSIYLAVMFAQNGSAIMVAILAETAFGTVGVTLISIGFTLLYFVFVEAMAKTFGILHSDRAALFLAPMVWFLARLLAGPTRLLIGLANVLLPGRGLKQGPFVSEEEIRSMADVGSQEGAIEEEEKELIHSVFEFGDTLVREVMVPRPDIVAVDWRKPLRAVQDLVLRHGYSRIPVYREDVDDVVGIVYAKDVLKALYQGKSEIPLRDLVRDAHFVPESKKVAELLREMQQQKFHIAIVSDEHGSVSGLVTLEDLLEELVGEITDEYDREEILAEPVGDGSFRVDGRMPIDEVNELLDVDLPQDEWDTVAGLVLGLFGAIPSEGEQVRFDGLQFTAEKVKGRRIAKVLITRLALGEHQEGAAEPSER
jgi:CBS domain containing-hemolysin-like protein